MIKTFENFLNENSELENLRKELISTIEAKMRSINNQDYEKAFDYNDLETILLKKIEEEVSKENRIYTNEDPYGEENWDDEKSWSQIYSDEYNSAFSKAAKKILKTLNELYPNEKI